MEVSQEKVIKVSKIKISNILGIESLEFSPTGMTMVEGPNGTGKSSTLDAIKSIVDGGHDATLLRKGAEKGEVVLVLDDGVVITKKVTDIGSTLDVRHPELGKISRPKAYIEKIADALSVNPVQILLAPPKKRLEAVLESIPMYLTEEEIHTISPGLSGEVNCCGHAMEVFSRIDKHLKDLRTGINRLIRDKQSTIAEMERVNPAGELANWTALVLDAESEMADLQVQATENKGEILRSCQEEVAKAEAEYTGEYSELEREFRTAKDRLVKKREDQKVASETRKQNQLEKLRGWYEPAYEQLAAKLAEGKAGAEANEKAKAMRSILEKVRSELEGALKESSGYTEIMERFQRLKESKLKDLPIKGMEIVDGEIKLDGIPFDRLNLSRKVELAVQIAKIRAGALPLICIDGVELMDSNTFELFREEIRRNGMQAVVSRVSDKPFAVRGEAA